MTDSPRTLNRRILALAVPALGALIAEPIFLIVDSAMVGHLGITPLAGLGIGGAVLQTVVGLMVFLAYSTTPAVARRVGAGDVPGAVTAGINGMWLALAIGAVLSVAGYLATPLLVAAFGAPDEVAAMAATYLGISMWGLPAMLIVFAATGLLRGLQDTVTPLWIAVLGFAANAGLNWVFMYGLGWGIAGSAMGTVVAQWGMVAVYVAIVARLARRHSAAIAPQPGAVRSSARSGGWLFLRTVSLRVSLLLTVGVATMLGTDELAGWQIVFTISSTAAFAMDALAIAAQALIGKSLGEGDEHRVRQVVRRTLAWGAWFGVLCGAVIAAASGVIGLLFTGDEEVARLLVPALVLMGITQPLAGLVYVLDGVLMGANDARYLAAVGAINLIPFVPYLALLAWLTPSGSWGLAALAAGFFVILMGMRFVTLARRIRGQEWLQQEA
ncbi:MAG: MATE family efflux transporter [Microbacteriaceae bacterium]|uniref:MATE family efflux transporter n=1 Tax=unclassified Microbacterium TaxID=2609290 RepID=UPI00097F1487|nr:MATE family efflux transporter [Microbacterium sp. JB110]RCS60901.1 MATE family efflux transporter [Microbacterium sp. JB110]SJM64159.1 DNA-damage-inducible protein F [Frigoribacterium sp. JB110]